MNSLRPLELTDIDAVMALEHELFPTDSWSREAFESEIRAPWTDYLALVDRVGIIQGYGGVSVPAPDAPADIQTIAVAAHARGKGYGSMLLAELGRLGHARGATESLLEVRADNTAAQALYAKFGYVEIAVRPRYYQPDDVDAIVMRAALPFPEAP